MRVGPLRRLSTKELMLLNCGAGEDSWESLGLKEIKPVNHKRNQLWICIGRTDAEAPVKLATWWDMTHWKRPWCWERLRVGGEGGDRGLDGWMASMIQWTWVWANSWRWWRTDKPGVLQSMGLQRVRHNLATEQQQPYCSGNSSQCSAVTKREYVYTCDWCTSMYCKNNTTL